MSDYTKQDIDQAALPEEYRESSSGQGFIPVSDNSKFFDGAGMGFVLEESRGYLIRMYTDGNGDAIDDCLCTEGGEPIYTSGERTSIRDRMNNRPLLIN